MTDTNRDPQQPDPQRRADRPPTAEEERAADAARDHVSDDVATHFEEMNEIGAEVKGEGEIEPAPGDD